MVDKEAVANQKQALLIDISEQFPLVNHQAIKGKAKDTLTEWEVDSCHKLTHDNPFKTHYAKLCRAEKQVSDKQANSYSIMQDIQDFEDFLSDSGLNQSTQFWRERVQEQKLLPVGSYIYPVHKLSDELKKQKIKQVALRATILQKWRRLYNSSYTNWELTELKKLRDEMFDKLKSWLKFLEKLQSIANKLSIELGRFLCLSQGTLTDQDITELEYWVDFFSKDQAVKNLCDMLGRLRHAQASKREEILEITEKIQVEIPDINSKEEIIGIKLGKTIEDTLSQELALLTNPDTSILFDLKYIESRLLNFENQGKQFLDVEEKKEITIQVDEKESMGPIIICVDTSGSMHGSPETIAKAVTLFLASRAIEQERKCYLINFSTGIETLDLSGDLGLPKVIEFLKKSFHGGTDVDPALEHAVKMIQTEDYEKADVLTISDFIMGRLGHQLTKNIMEIKEKNNKFYSLCIGSSGPQEGLKEIFDGHWVYDPYNSNITALYTDIEMVGKEHG